MLVYASYTNKIEVIRILLKYGADVNAVTLVRFNCIFSRFFIYSIIYTVGMFPIFCEGWS